MVTEEKPSLNLTLRGIATGRISLVSEKKKKKGTVDAVQILKNRYVKGDAEAEALLDEIEFNDEVARKIYELRSEAGLTQKELADMVGTQPSAICRLEDADYEGHSLAMLRKVAKALNKRVVIDFVSDDELEAA
jgi:DNA-binding XRE family transcriptional regulator